MAGQQAIGIALSKNGISTILSGALPLLANEKITVAPLDPMSDPLGSGLEPELLQIYNIAASQITASLVSLVQNPSQAGPPPSCVFDVTTHIGLHVTATWEESGDTGT